MANPYTRKPPFGTPLDRSNSRVNGLIGAWDLLETGGLIAYDSTQRYGNGVFNNAPVHTVVQGYQCVDFSQASSQQITITHNPLYRLDKKSANNPRFTISALVRLKSLRNYNGIVTKSLSSFGDRFDLYMNAAGQWEIWASGNNNVQINGITAGVWIHVLLSVDYLAGTVPQWRYWLNGINASTQNVFGSASADTGKDIRIGNIDAGGCFMDGQIASVRLWDRSLSSAEVIAEYQNPWSIYKLRTNHFTLQGAVNYAESIALAAQVSATLAAKLGTTGAIALHVGATMPVLGSQGRIQSISLAGTLNALVNGSKGQAGALTLAQTVTLTESAQRSTNPSLSLSAQVNVTLAARLQFVASMALHSTLNAVIDSKSSLAAVLALAVRMDAPISGSQHFQDVLHHALTVTCGPRGGFLFDRDFALGVVMDTPPFVSGFQYAKTIALAMTEHFAIADQQNYPAALALAISQHLQTLTQFGATGHLTFNVHDALVLTSNIGAHSSMSLAIGADVACAGGFLYALTLEIAAEFTMSQVAALHAVGMMSLGIQLHEALAAKKNTDGSLTLATAIHLALRQNAQLKAALDLDVTVDEINKPSKGRTLDMALGFVAGMLAAQSTAGGPAGFGGQAAGHPDIFQPEGEPGTPGIFEENEEGGPPGIWKPKKPLT